MGCEGKGWWGGARGWFPWEGGGGGDDGILCGYEGPGWF